MRFAHHLIRRRNGMFYYRQRVPVDLQGVLGIRFVQVSLRTRDVGVARIYSHALSLRYAQAFADLRGAAVPKPPSVEDILASFGRRGGAFEIELDRATHRPIRVKTDGTEHDNRAALEALRALTQAVGRSAPMVPSVPPKSALTLSAAIKLYEEAEAASLKPNTWSQRERAMKSLEAALGGKTPVASISREQAGDWAQGLLTQPSLRKKEAPISKRSVGNAVSHAAQLFAFLIQRGKYEGVNPVKGLVVMTKKEKARRRDEGHEWEPFDLGALRQIYDPQNFTRIRTGHTRWAAVIALYTGARASEIAQLYLADFVEEDGIACLRISTQSDGQSVKTEASRRLVPIHPDLARLGLIDRVATLRKEGHERLFPDMRIDGRAGAGNAVSKGFGYYLGKLKIKPRRANGIVGLHSLRKTVIQQLQGSRVSSERRRAFVGHEPGEDVHATNYMRPWAAGELAELFPGLPWATWLQVDALKVMLRKDAES
jgi:integrase